jgi:hypothetical protein
MASHVVERFVNDPIKGRLNRSRETLAAEPLDSDWMLHSLGHPLGEQFQRGHQAKVVENGGTELV